MSPAQPPADEPLVMPTDKDEYDRMRDADPRPGPCCNSAGPVAHWPMYHCRSVNGPGKPIRPHCTCGNCF
jgi:hypothetical protein